MVAQLCEMSQPGRCHREETVPTTPAAASIAKPVPARLLQDAASMFALLSATVRLHILCELTHGDRDVGTLAATTGQSITTVSHHLSKLKLAGVVRASRQGKRVVYAMADAHVVEVIRVAIDSHLDHDRTGAQSWVTARENVSARTISLT
jgi:DNA-binding transcriptional ArsR family regulator